MKDILSIEKPQKGNKRPSPVVFDSPHSGTIYPADFNYACSFDDLQATEDKYVDALFASVPEHGGTLLLAHFPRCYIDTNRSVDDIDPGLLAEKWPYGEINPTSRSDAGIGLIRRLVKPGVPVYDQDLSPETIKHRIEAYYTPYHAALEKLIDETHYSFGQIYHINCHSMPDSTAVPKQPTALMGYRVKPVDFVLGNLDGTSCEIGFTHALRDFIKDMGYSVTINDPFKGVELISRYADPARGRHSLQLEINKALYMNEETFEKNKNYTTLKADIEKLIAFCAEYAQAQPTDLAAD